MTTDAPDIIPVETPYLGASTLWTVVQGAPQRQAEPRPHAHSRYVREAGGADMLKSRRWVMAVWTVIIVFTVSGRPFPYLLAHGL